MSSLYGDVARGFPGYGHLVLITAPNPGAGNDWVLTPPAGSVWRVLWGSAKLVTSASAGTRQVTLQLLTGNLVVGQMASPDTQATGLTYTYQFVPGIAQPTLASTFPVVSLPALLLLDPRWTLQSSTSGILAGDVWSGVSFLVEELAPAPPE